MYFNQRWQFWMRCGIGNFENVGIGCDAKKFLGIGLDLLKP